MREQDIRCNRYFADCRNCSYYLAALILPQMVKCPCKGPHIAAILLLSVMPAASAQNAPANNSPSNSVRLERLPTGLLGSAESDPGSQPDPNAGLIKVDLTVTDPKGNYITGLSKSDLNLIDDGQPRNIVTFQAFDGTASKPDVPAEIILVIDEIDTPQVLIGAAEETAQKILLQHGGHLTQPVMVYRINSEGLFASFAPSYDGNALANQILGREEARTIWRAQDIAGSFRRDIYGSTARSAQSSTFNEQWTELPHPLIALASIAIEERRVPGRKLMFWIGNPWPIRPSRWQHLFDAVTELSTRLREARIAIWFHNFAAQPDFTYQSFLPGATSEKAVSIQNVALQVLAVQSGGGEIEGDGETADLISRQIAKANHFYTITFDPPRAETVDDYHTVKVEIAKPGLTAKMLTGYYNEPSYYDQEPNGIQRVKIAQLRDSIPELRALSDSEAARRLAGMELIERLSSTQFAELFATLTGKKTREALIALADQSAFLFPPVEETLEQPPPTIQEQRQIVQRAVTYVSRTIPILPDLSAQRSTTLYLEPTRPPGRTWKTATGDQSLYSVSVTKAAVHVAGGKEVAEQLKSSADQRGMKARGIYERRSLETEGVFGPILASVLIAVAQPGSKLMWARWEKGSDGAVAVFRYNIPSKSSMFHVGFCCLAIDGVQKNFENDASSSGEIAIAPSTGTILRLTVRAELSWRLPLQHSDIMIEYGHVMLGGTSYTCPIRSVELSRQRSVVQLSEFGERLKVYAPFETVLNDVKYDNYHLFQSTSRVLPGFTEIPNTK